MGTFPDIMASGAARLGSFPQRVPGFLQYQSGYFNIFNLNGYLMHQFLVLLELFFQPFHLGLQPEFAL
jgi:hypothetical protein